jgi:hypothetical protein
MSFSVFIADLKEIFATLRFDELSPIFFVGLWLMALFASLRGIDRRDEMAHVTYVAVLLAIGIFLFYGLPFGARNSHGRLPKLSMFIFLIILPSLRWMYQRKRTDLDDAISKSENNAKLVK